MAKKRLIIGVTVGVVLVLLYWASRLANLTIIPIFTDEAIYLRWAQIALGDPKWRFISLIDGKQPLFIWLIFPFLKIIADPLIAGRMVSVVAGFFALLGFAGLGYFLTKTIRGALIAGGIYLIIPFFLMYDRLAVYDGLLTSIAIWSLLLTLILAKTERLSAALLLGTVVGAGLLTKSSANFFWYLLPASALLVVWKRKQLKEQILRFIGLIVVVIIQSQIYNNIMLLSEFRYMVARKETSFIYTLSEFLSAPLSHTWGNLYGLGNWLVGYLTVPVILLVIISFFWLIRKNWKLGLFLLIYFAVPFVGLAAFGRVIYPRFILFMIVPLLLSAVMFLESVIFKQTKFVVLGVVLLCFTYAAYFDFKVVTDPIHAPIPSSDRQQLINDWPAGYGINEVINYVDQESKRGPVVVGTEGTFGLYPMAFELYLGTNKNVTFKAYYPVNEVPLELLELAKTTPTYLAFKEREHIPADWPLQLIAQYQRGNGPTHLKFYRVVPRT